MCFRRTLKSIIRNEGFSALYKSFPITYVYIVVN
jgi:hypothetical protein